MLSLCLLNEQPASNPQMRRVDTIVLGLYRKGNWTWEGEQLDLGRMVCGGTLTRGSPGFMSRGFPLHCTDSFVWNPPHDALWRRQFPGPERHSHCLEDGDLKLKSRRNGWSLHISCRDQQLWVCLIRPTCVSQLSSVGLRCTYLRTSGVAQVSFRNSVMKPSMRKSKAVSSLLPKVKPLYIDIIFRGIYAHTPKSNHCKKKFFFFLIVPGGIMLPGCNNPSGSVNTTYAENKHKVKWFFLENKETFLQLGPSSNSYLFIDLFAKHRWSTL